MPWSDLALEPRRQLRDTQIALWVFFLTVALLFVAVTVRALLDTLDTPLLRPTLALLLAWLLLLLGGAALARRHPRWFVVCLSTQALLVVGLMLLTGGGDYFAALLMILAMQIVRQFGARLGARWIALFALLLLWPWTPA